MKRPGFNPDNLDFLTNEKVTATVEFVDPSLLASNYGQEHQRPKPISGLEVCRLKDGERHVDLSMALVDPRGPFNRLNDLIAHRWGAFTYPPETQITRIHTSLTPKLKSEEVGDLSEKELLIALNNDQALWTALFGLYAIACQRKKFPEGFRINLTLSEHYNEEQSNPETLRAIIIAALKHYVSITEKQRKDSGKEPIELCKDPNKKYCIEANYIRSIFKAMARLAIKDASD